MLAPSTGPPRNLPTADRSRRYASTVFAARCAVSSARKPSTAAPSCSPVLRSGMGMVIDLAEALGVDVAVHLGGRQRGVAQELLDRAEVGAAFEQMRRERMPEPMRVGDEPAQRRRVQPSSVGRQEQRVVRATRELWPRVAEIPRDEERGLFAERD